MRDKLILAILAIVMFLLVITLVGCTTIWPKTMTAGPFFADIETERSFSNSFIGSSSGDQEMLGGIILFTWDLEDPFEGNSLWRIKDCSHCEKHDTEANGGNVPGTIRNYNGLHKGHSHAGIK